MKKPNNIPQSFKKLFKEVSDLPAEQKKWIKLGVFSSFGGIFLTIFVILLISFIIIWLLLHY